MENQLDIFEPAGDNAPPASPNPSQKDKEYFDARTAEERFRKMKMDNDLKAGQLVYKSEAVEAMQQICGVFQTALKAFEEIMPYEAYNKSFEESKRIHITAVEEGKRNILKALKSFAGESVSYA